MSIKQLGKSFSYAWQGFVLVFRSEQNFRLQLIIGLIAVIVAMVFDFPAWKMIVLIWVIIIVLVLELINSIFERLMDAFHPRVHGIVREMKDIMAATVLLASFGAVIIGLMLFWRSLFSLFE